MLSKFFTWLFKPYEEDFLSPYVHNGVGYTGVDFDVWNPTNARTKHCGIGYTGIYDE